MAISVASRKESEVKGLRRKSEIAFHSRSIVCAVSFSVSSNLEKKINITKNSFCLLCLFLSLNLSLGSTFDLEEGFGEWQGAGMKDEG